MAEARRAFFAREGFAPDGGYDDAWADATFAGIPYSVPNPKARGDALRVHDLHHVVTGYATDWRGESEISAWELGSGGGGGYRYAWFIALFGLFVGLLALPGATWRAFRRGWGARNLYGETAIDRWLPRPVADVRRELRIRERPTRATLGAAVAFVTYAIAAIVGSIVFVLGTPMLVALAFGRRLRCPLTCAQAG